VASCSGSGTVPGVEEDALIGSLDEARTSDACGLARRRQHIVEGEVVARLYWISRRGPPESGVPAPPRRTHHLATPGTGQQPRFDGPIGHGPQLHQ